MLPTRAPFAALAAGVSHQDFTRARASYLESAPFVAARQLDTPAAGSRGSILPADSATGVAVMGQARGIYTFFAQLKRNRDLPPAFMYTPRSMRQRKQGQGCDWNRITPYAMD